MDGDDIEVRLNGVKNMLDELSKEIQHIVQAEVDRTPEGLEPNVGPLERCIARTSATTLMINDIIHDLSVVKHNVATLYDMLGCVNDAANATGSGKKKK